MERRRHRLQGMALTAHCRPRLLGCSLPACPLALKSHQAGAVDAAATPQDADAFAVVQPAACICQSTGKRRAWARG